MTVSVSCDQVLLDAENASSCLCSLYAAESGMRLIKQCPAGASFFVYKYAVFLLCFHSNIITKGHHNAGNKAIGFCHTVGWYELHVTSDINALYIS